MTDAIKRTCAKIVRQCRVNRGPELGITDRGTAQKLNKPSWLPFSKIKPAKQILREEE